MSSPTSSDDRLVPILDIQSGAAAVRKVLEIVFCMLIGGSLEVVPRTAVDEATLDGKPLDLGSIRRACEELLLAAVDQVCGFLTAELPRRATADATDRRDARTVAQEPLSTALHF
jgi:hypothetical protein